MTRAAPPPPTAARRRPSAALAALAPVDRILVAAVGAYAALVAVLMAAHGVPLTADVALFGAGLVLLMVIRLHPRLAARLPALARELLPLGILFMAYELQRGYSGAHVGDVHIADVIALERALFLGAIPTEALQSALHVPGVADPLAAVATIFYVLHFGLPFALGALLWTRRRAAFHDFVAALVILSIAGFATYLVLPVAPPWYAAESGVLVTGAGTPAVEYLKAQGVAELAALAGGDGSAAFDFVIHQVNPNLVGAFPSLHAAYPTLAFLLLRRAFGRAAWLVLAYALAVWLSIVYLADHYVVDVLGGIAYAGGAAWLVRRGVPGMSARTPLPAAPALAEA